MLNPYYSIYVNKVLHYSLEIILYFPIHNNNNNKIKDDDDDDIRGLSDVHYNSYIKVKKKVRNEDDIIIRS